MILWIARTGAPWRDLPEEFGQGNALIEDFSADFALADRGYDSNAFLLEIKKSSATQVIPPKRNRVNQ